jgi:hypothetical protein
VAAGGEARRVARITYVGPTFGLILEPRLHSFVGFFSNLRIALFMGRREYSRAQGVRRPGTSKECALCSIKTLARRRSGKW